MNDRVYEMTPTNRGKLRALIPVLMIATATVCSLSLPDAPFRLLGIAPQDEVYFAGELIACKDGSRFFGKDRLNDVFCDCPDGTDEPGTSACPEGRFYCRNATDKPIFLFSSRVNDHICDCCDGTDEYDGTITCPNTCSKDAHFSKNSAAHGFEFHRKIVNLDDRILRSKELWGLFCAELLIAMCVITFCFLRLCNKSKKRNRRSRS